MEKICINIPSCSNQLLLAIVYLLTAGILLVSGLMKATLPFLVDVNNNKVSIMSLEWPQSYVRLTILLDSLTEKSKDVVRLNLRLDFVWMLFLYPLMITLGAYVWRCTTECAWLLYIICLLPLINWLFDIAENFFTLNMLKRPTSKRANLMGAASVLKWFTGAVYMLLFLYLISCVIDTNCIKH